MKTIKVGGVPEHFNYPWHHAIFNDLFIHHNLDVEWFDVKSGSGAMCKMLDTEDLDLAIVLTEGIVKHIADGSKARIVQHYVKSPLIWGIHCSPSFLERGNLDLSQARFARSKEGSGSHIMAFVDAHQKSYSISEDNFVTVGNIEGAVSAFMKDEADILLWEKFMTQPFVDQGYMHRIAECISPWPCFVLVASEKFQRWFPKELGLMANLIVRSCKEVMHDPNSIENIAEKYNLDPKQVKQWYAMTEWQTSNWISARTLSNVVSTLEHAGLIDKEVNVKELCCDQSHIY